MKPLHGGKLRARRIPLGFNKRPDKMVRAKLIGAALAAVAVVAWSGAALFQRGLGAKRFSPGEVAEVHATWDAKCIACHEPFKSVRDGALEVSFAGLTAADDNRCIKCHNGAPHHATEIPSEVGSCSRCHYDHQGRLANISRPANVVCTSCHADMSRHMRTAEGFPAITPPLAETVTEFESDHPPFRSISTDPGQVRFNHDLHMTAGLNVGFSDRQLASKDRAKYEMKDGLVQMACGDCHGTDGEAQDIELARAATARSGSGIPARFGNGDYMVPVRYEDHCQACHPLSYQAGQPLDEMDVVPHRLIPSEIRGYLASVFGGGEEVNSSEPSEDKVDLMAPLTGPLGSPPAESEYAELQEAISGAEKHLRNVCAQCHILDVSGGGAAGGLEPVLPSQIPEVWYRFARFDHTAHRAVTCQECHADAYPESERTSSVNTDVMIPDRDICLKCHSSEGAGKDASGASLGGARHDCVECHRYHGGDYPLHGAGSKVRSAGKMQRVRDFLLGAESD